VRSRDAADALLADAARRPAHAAAAKALETEGYRYDSRAAKAKGRGGARRRRSGQDAFRARRRSDASSDETSSNASSNGSASDDGSRSSASSRFSSLDRLTTLARHWQRGGDPARASGVLALAGDAKAAEGSFSEAAAWYSAAAATLRASFKEGVVSFETRTRRRGAAGAEYQGVVLETSRTRVLALAEWTVLESEARLRAGESRAAEKRARDAVELTRVLLSRDDAVAPLDVLERAFRNARIRLLGLLFHPGKGAAAGAAAALTSVVSRCFGSRFRREKKKGPETEEDPRAAETAPSVNAGEGAGEDFFASRRVSSASLLSHVAPVSRRRREARGDGRSGEPSDVARVAVRARELAFLASRRRRDALAWRRDAKRFAERDGYAKESPERAAFFELHARRAAEGAAKARRGDAMTPFPREDGDAGRTKRRCYFL
jgi:hypothetical protein